MPSEGREPAYYSDMLSAAEAVVRFVAGRTYADLLADDMLQASVERKIEIIGEAARRISDGGRAAHPEIEWRKIIATRLKLLSNSSTETSRGPPLGSFRYHFFGP